MNLNPPPIAAGWADKSTSGPALVWSVWFTNLYAFLTGGTSGTATIAPAGGAITSYTATFRYSKIGNLVVLLFDITITNAGTGTGDITVNLPHTTTSIVSGSGQEITSTGYACTCAGVSGGTSFTIHKYDGTTIIATGNRIIGSVTYFA